MRALLVTGFGWSGMFCVLATLAACGGGGGGGTGGSESDSGYGVRVLHAAIDAAPVDIVSSAASSPLVSQQVFAGAKGYRPLPSASQTLTLTRTRTPSDVIASFSVAPTSEEKYSVLLYGDNATFGLRTRFIKDEVPESIDGAFVRVINGVTKAAEVSVSVANAPAETIPFGQNTSYIQTSSGAVQISVLRVADGYPIQSGPITLDPGKAYTLLLSGELGYYVKSVLFTDS